MISIPITSTAQPTATARLASIRPDASCAHADAAKIEQTIAPATAWLPMPMMPATNDGDTALNRPSTAKPANPAVTAITNTGRTWAGTESQWNTAAVAVPVATPADSPDSSLPSNRSSTPVVAKNATALPSANIVASGSGGNYIGVSWSLSLGEGKCRASVMLECPRRLCYVSIIAVCGYVVRFRPRRVGSACALLHAAA